MAVALVCQSAAPRQAWAEDAGKRDFPATLVVDEPQVETEIAPQIASWTADRVRRTDFSTDVSLKLAAPLSVILKSDFTSLRPGSSGLQDTEVGLKYQFVANAEHEFIFSAGLSSILGRTGSPAVGADTFTTVVPTLYFGKGAGDLPDSLAWAQPFAVTGQLGFEAPLQARSRPLPPTPGAEEPYQSNPYALVLEGSFQYSFAYAAANVSAIEWPKSLKGLIPLVEYEIEIPIANNGSRVPATGTIDPGVLWLIGDVTLGLEALIPINRQSGTHPGVRLQLSYSFATPWPLAGGGPSVSD